MKKNSSLDYLIISSAYPYRGGISDSTHSLVNEMSNQNINCEVWTFKLLYPKLFFPGKTQYSKEVFKSNFKILREINTLNPINWIITARKINKIGPKKIIFRYWTPLLSLAYFSISCILKNKIKVIGLVDNWSGHETVVFENIFRNNRKNGIKISINFLLHPEVAVVLENGSINFCLTNGERYSLSYSNKYHVEIEENNYYEDSKGKLSATKQVVLSSYLMNYDNTMNWSITKF